jgi:hypothetical protein
LGPDTGASTSNVTVGGVGGAEGSVMNLMGKYFKEVQDGAAVETVAHKMLADGVISSLPIAIAILGSLSQGFTTARAASAPNTPAINNNGFGSNDSFEDGSLGQPGYAHNTVLVPVYKHPLYAPYFDMLKRGTPRAEVEQKMRDAGLDPSILNHGETKIEEVDKEAAKKDGKLPAREHPLFEKYFKMLKAGVPRPAVENKMRQEGLNEAVLETPDKRLAPDDKGFGAPVKADQGEMVKISEHPLYAKFFKMLKVGLPPPVVKNKVTAEGLDPAMMDKDPSELVPLHPPKEDEGEMVPAGEHPSYAKFFKMLKVGCDILRMYFFLHCIYFSSAVEVSLIHWEV